MAFWGAPKPAPQHPIIACRTAMANQQALVRLREKWSAEGRPEIRARIGLHTGEAIVGNFGSESRLDYTAIGDAVNLASRLEAINKLYGTEIIMSEATHARVKDQIVSRPLDRVAVKGKSEGIMIYELVGAVGAVDGDLLARVETYRRGLDSYLARRWSQAIADFERVLEADPGDLASRLMLSRAREYAAEPPPRRWSGVYRVASK
jgi:adenylate cyclase